MNGPGTTTGNVGVTSSSADVQLNASSGHKAIDGNLVLQPGATVNNTAQVTGSVSSSNLATVWLDAVQASVAFDQLTVTNPAITSIGNSTGTITSTGALNVIDITHLKLNQGKLTLSGSATDQFVINVTGGFVLNGSQIDLTGGLTPSDVVFNVVGTGSALQTSGGLNQESVVTGILLAPNRSVAFAPGLVDGELIAGGSSVHLVSGGSVFCRITAIPEPGTLTLLAAALFGAGLLKTWKMFRAA